MIKALIKVAEKLTGMHAGIKGSISVRLRGEISPDLRGDISGLRGDISGLWGEISIEGAAAKIWNAAQRFLDFCFLLVRPC